MYIADPALEHLEICVRVATAVLAHLLNGQFVVVHNETTIPRVMGYK